MEPKKILTARPAKTMNNKPVSLHCKAGLFSQFFLEFLYILVNNFGQCTAVYTVKVIMMIMVKQMLVPDGMVVQSQFPSQAAVTDELNSSIYSGNTYRWILFLDQAKKFVSSQVLFGLQKGFQNIPSLAALLETLALYAVIEYVYLFLEHHGLI